MWYVATFGLILVLLGSGLFYVIRAQIGRQLDRSLEAAARELKGAAAIRALEAKQAHGTVVDAVDELHIPDRALFLTTIEGHAVKPDTAPVWVATVAIGAARDSVILANVHPRRGAHLRVFAERFRLQDGTSYVAVAAADRVELEDRYASLIGAFGGAALAALLLVAAGGYLLMRESTAPVERSMMQMRRFMADAAHELRTPIAVLRSRAEVAQQRERDPAAYTAALRGVEEEAGRLGRIVEDLLTLAHADAGERPVVRERLYLDDVALDAADAARALARRRGVSLAVGTFEEAPVTGDPALVRQLLMIVLDNAVKFTPEGGHVRVDVTARDGASVVTVNDTGIGIAADQAPHVFERFFRGEHARERAPGAGLGLSIARWIADAHGATIDLHSEPGRGTQVTIRFPRPAPV